MPADGVEEDEAALGVDEVVPEVQLDDGRGVHQELGDAARAVVLDLVVREVQLGERGVEPQPVDERLDHVVVDVVARQFQLDDVRGFQEVIEVHAVPRLHLLRHLLRTQLVHLPVLRDPQFRQEPELLLEVFQFGP